MPFLGIGKCGFLCYLVYVLSGAVAKEKSRKIPAVILGNLEGKSYKVVDIILSLILVRSRFIGDRPLCVCTKVVLQIKLCTMYGITVGHFIWLLSLYFKDSTRILE